MTRGVARSTDVAVHLNVPLRGPDGVAGLVIPSACSDEHQLTRHSRLGFMFFYGPGVGVRGAHLDNLCTTEAVVVFQSSGGRCVHVKPERDLCLE